MIADQIHIRLLVIRTKLNIPTSFQDENECK